MLRWILLTSFVLNGCLISMAQESKKIKNPRESELNGWLGFKLDHKIAKKLEGKFNQQLRLKDDFQNLSAIFTNLSLDYDLPKKWEASASIRVGYLPLEDKFLRIYSDISRDFKNIGRLDLDWRLRLQQEWQTENKEEALVRNKIEANYNFKNSKFNASLAIEIFNSLNNNPGLFQFTSYRTTLSVDRKLNKRNGLNVFIALDRNINDAPLSNQLIIGAAWSMSPKFKKKKKKNNEDAES